MLIPGGPGTAAHPGPGVGVAGSRVYPRPGYVCIVGKRIGYLTRLIKPYNSNPIETQLKPYLNLMQALSKLYENPRIPRCRVYPGPRVQATHRRRLYPGPWPARCMTSARRCSATFFIFVWISSRPEIVDFGGLGGPPGPPRRPKSMISGWPTSSDTN